jgi:hypothetical protein
MIVRLVYCENGTSSGRMNNENPQSVVQIISTTYTRFPQSLFDVSNSS